MQVQHGDHTGVESRYRNLEQQSTGGLSFSWVRSVWAEMTGKVIELNREGIAEVLHLLAGKKGGSVIGSQNASLTPVSLTP